MLSPGGNASACFAARCLACSTCSCSDLPSPEVVTINAAAATPLKPAATAPRCQALRCRRSQVRVRSRGSRSPHRQASNCVRSSLASVSRCRYIELLEGLYLLRSLPPWTRNVGKRLVKSPKIYWRDNGILHSLIGLADLEQVLGHPVCGASWEGYCIEQILNRVPRGWTASHYRTHAGAEVDLVLEDPGGNILAVEIKRTLSPKLTSGMIESMQTLRAERGVIVIPEGEAYPLSQQVEAIGLIPFLDGLP